MMFSVWELLHSREMQRMALSSVGAICNQLCTLLCTLPYALSLVPAALWRLVLSFWIYPHAVPWRCGANKVYDPERRLNTISLPRNTSLCD